MQYDRDPPTHCANRVCRARTRALALPLTMPSLPAVFLSLLDLSKSRPKSS